MSSKMLCLCVRAAAIAVALCGIFLMGYMLPLDVAQMVQRRPELNSVGWAWQIFLWVVSLPFFIVLVYGWKISTAIRLDQVFTLKTAGWFKSGALLLFAGTGLFLLGNVVFALLGLSDPPVLMLSCIIIFGISLAVCAAVLSRYISKAAVLQDESEGTI